MPLLCSQNFFIFLFILNIIFSSLCNTGSFYLYFSLCNVQHETVITRQVIHHGSTSQYFIQSLSIMITLMILWERTIKASNIYRLRKHVKLLISGNQVQVTYNGGRNLYLTSRIDVLSYSHNLHCVNLWMYLFMFHLMFLKIDESNKNPHLYLPEGMCPFSLIFYYNLLSHIIMIIPI